MLIRFIGLISIFILQGLIACTAKVDSGGSDGGAASTYSFSMEMTRLTTATPNPFQVSVTLKKDGAGLAGQSLQLTVPNGTTSAIADVGGGTYQFTVTPSAYGLFPVTVSFNGTSIKRTAIVMNSYGSGVGQPMTVPGDYVNTDGYEDGVTITPDGQYLFVQYGPLYFSGLFSIGTICSSGSYSIGYDLNTCSGRTNSSMVFNSIGPYNTSIRPNFPSVGINTNGTFKHITSLVISGTANGIIGFPTVFYGFKKQSDGTFAEPFKVAFNDERGLSGPFGISFKPNSNGTTDFAIAWNNYYNDLGDDKPDIYTGTLTLGQNKNLGDIVYSGEMFTSITPYVNPVSFSSHTGTQGNPYLELDGSGNVKAIWTDDEASSHDLSVYRLTAGTYPSGTWVKDTLPSVINTAGEESQPTMIGNRLYMNRDLKIIYHEYRPTNGACSSGYTSADCWGPEVVLLQASGSTTVGQIFGVGEPTVANADGKKLLYFVFVESRANALVSGIADFNMNAGFVEIP